MTQDKAALVEPANAQRIAKRLTENQQNLLFFWPKGLFSAVTFRALFRMGLINGREVTPLGKAVIRALANQEPSQ